MSGLCRVWSLKADVVVPYLAICLAKMVVCLRRSAHPVILRCAALRCCNVLGWGCTLPNPAFLGGGGFPDLVLCFQDGGGISVSDTFTFLDGWVGLGKRKWG